MASDDVTRRTDEADSRKTEDVDDLGETRDLERLLVHRIIMGMLIAVPVAIALILGLLAIALGSDPVRWTAPVLMAVGIGTLVGVFFGGWAGFVSTTHAFEQLDATRDPRAHPPFGTPVHRA